MTANEYRARRRRGLFTLLGPGLLVAATGVGAGDLATAAFTGSHLGTTVLWAVLLGAAIKFVLNEGLARWQLVTGETLLEGAVSRLGKAVGWIFLGYLLVWTFFTASALMSACGVALHSMVPIVDDPGRGKIIYGIFQSALGVGLVLAGGFRLFERIMEVCIGVMFLTVIVTAVLVAPDVATIARGLLVPTIPDLSGAGLGWTVALMGGVGGTLTVLSYGYWIREQGREGPEEIGACRIDLGVAYAMTALFGVAMVVIGSTVEVDGKGAGLILSLASRLEEPLGTTGRWLFLLGAWCALFSSLLGVWQAVPYLFADFCLLVTRPGKRLRVDTRGRAYRFYLFALATTPTLGLLFSFQAVQKSYAVFGALCMPMLAGVLLVLNGRRAWVGEWRNRRVTVMVMVLTVGFFGWIVGMKVVAMIGG